MDSRYSRFGKNTILVIIGNLGSKFMSFLMLPFYTKWLPVEEYGEVDVINIYVSFLIGIVTCAIAEAIFVFPKGIERSKQISYFSSGVNFIILVYLVLAAVFELLDYLFSVHNVFNSFSNNLWSIYGILITSSLQQFFQQFTRSIDKIVTYSVSGIVLTIVSIIISLILIPVYGVVGYITATIIGHLVAALYACVCSKAYQFYSFKESNKKACLEMLKYSTPLVPNNVMWWIVNALNRPVMEACLGLEAIGLFAVANKFPAAISNAFAMFAISWQISVLEEFGKDGYCNFFNRIFRWVIFVMVIGGCIISIFSYEIIGIFADPKYVESWRYVPVLTLSSLFLAVSGFAGSNFSATKESKYFFYSSVWGALTALVANAIFIPMMGTMGACISVVFSFLVMSYSRCYYCWRYVRIKNWGRIFFSILFNICVIVVVLIALPSTWKVVLYLIFIFSILITNKDILKDIVKLIKK